MAEIARRFGMSPCWFTRLFHRQTGLSPQRYLTDIRINKARELLGHRQLQRQRGGGFNRLSQPAVFQPDFQKVHGVSPSQYKQRQAAEKGVQNG